MSTKSTCAIPHYLLNKRKLSCGQSAFLRNKLQPLFDTEDLKSLGIISVDASWNIRFGRNSKDLYLKIKGCSVFIIDIEYHSIHNRSCSKANEYVIAKFVINESFDSVSRYERVGFKNNIFKLTYNFTENVGIITNRNDGDLDLESRLAILKLTLKGASLDEN